ncbi:MAG TPA: 7,8-didemethyl-8-hydroxy-5-deazariboflavin synthase CofG [Acidimicrobiia bacterium]|nr:7,8-didemethyl-8-hydroxy-5-deazariboflavin synthase CofG [Acidimicrobiia bacterium]
MLTTDEAFRLTRFSFSDLADSASAIRDDFSRHFITYSPSTFLPITHVCRSGCSYCTFVHEHNPQDSPFMPIDDIRRVGAEGVADLCGGALFTLCENPAIQSDVATEWLINHGYPHVIDYLLDVAHVMLAEFELLPYINSGTIADKDLLRLKDISVAQGLMLDTLAGRLSEPGGPYYGSPHKSPARRLATLEAAGRVQIPFSTGMLVGVGDTRHERIEGLLALRDLNARYGHIQEVIIRNFLPKSPEMDEEYLWSIAAARLVFENTTHIQASISHARSVTDLIRAGIDDFGRISPVASDGVHGEKPWPHLTTLSTQLQTESKRLRARAPIYPDYIQKPGFVSDHLKGFISKLVNANGYLARSPLDAGDANFTKGKIEAQLDSAKVIDLTKDDAQKKKTGNKMRERTTNFPTSRPTA